MADKKLDKETMKAMLERMIKNTNDERLAQADMLFGEDWRDMVKMAHMEYFNIPQKTELSQIMDAIDNESIKFIVKDTVISDDNMKIMRRFAKRSHDVEKYLSDFLTAREESGSNFVYDRCSAILCGIITVLRGGTVSPFVDEPVWYEPTYGSREQWYDFVVSYIMSSESVDSMKQHIAAYEVIDRLYAEQF
jgi:hypothetical protein